MSVRCPRCGATYADGVRFCPSDGTRLTAKETTELRAFGAPGAELRSPDPTAPPRRSTVARSAPPRSRTTVELDVADMAGRTLDRRYHVVGMVGQGGMSYVYLAEDVTTKQKVAIKVLTSSLATDKIAVARLRREAALGLRLVHPNICHIMRLGETESGLLYVVMPFLDGELLCDRIRALGQLPLAQAAKLVGDIATGLQVAHRLQIIHRDLKPENVMLCRDEGGADRAVIMDFGLAKERRVGPELEKLTSSGTVLGTPEFLSPEQLRCKPLDARSDIYSLGLVACEMLTGKLPFAGRTQQDVMIARLRGEAIPIRRLRPDLDLPAAVERVLLTCLQHDPDDRYQTAPAFAKALAQAAEGGDRERGVFGRLLGR